MYSTTPWYIARSGVYRSWSNPRRGRPAFPSRAVRSSRRALAPLLVSSWRPSISLRMCGVTLNASGTETYGYTQDEQLSSETGSTASSFAYDAANNPTTVGTATQTFDAAGQLQASRTTSYTYNTEGERTAATPPPGPRPPTPTTRPAS
jgi:hypothetical protein